MEVNFHGETRNKTWLEARADFLDAYRTAIQSGSGAAPTISVIHGYGSTGVGGTLRTRFRAFLARHEGRLDFKPGEDIDGNRGWTLVQAISALPDDEEDLEDLILEYCQQPRTLEKIAGKFRRFGDRSVRHSVESLLKSPQLLKKAVKSGREMYQSV